MSTFSSVSGEITSKMSHQDKRDLMAAIIMAGRTIAAEGLAIAPSNQQKASRDVYSLVDTMLLVSGEAGEEE